MQHAVEAENENRLRTRRRLAWVVGALTLALLIWAFLLQEFEFWRWMTAIAALPAMFVILVLHAKGPKQPPREPDFPSKSIILFSDGTGNSSAKIFKTNVWRLYQALDLGPAQPEADQSQGVPKKAQQIAAYYNGVGTSSFRPFEILGGVFGFGLKRNVLELYRFLCRNFHDGDKIYAFGFSRGAFTIRALVALVASEGVVDYDDERDLAHKTSEAYRLHLSRETTGVPLLTRAIRAARSPFLWVYDRLLWRKSYAQAKKHDVKIEFVGVWDTVAAYGGPIAEITRGIDKWIYPLSMSNYELSEKVKCARHALALDDERDSFQPLVWDEVHEEQLIRAQKHKPEAERTVTPDRLKQVWFAGMHSDVGGGYPDESLSYISLMWMIDELGDRLRFVDIERERYSALANAFAPIHDSREGLAAYYRYQPRKIEALMHYPDEDGQTEMRKTAQMRDPFYARRNGKWRGLLTSCRVHESVFVRIAAGTDNYAPITLPRNFEIEQAKTNSHLGNPNYALLSDEVERIMAQDADKRADAQEAIWDWAWARRITYFVTLLVSLVLALFPWWGKHVDVLNISTDHRWALRTPIGWMEPLVPGLLKPWFQAFAESTIVFTLFVLVIIACLGLSQWQERNLRDETRLLWWQAMDKDRTVVERPLSRTQLIRQSSPYQLGFHVLKWHVLPFMFGMTMLLMLLYGVVIGAAQLRLVYAEHNVFCADGLTVDKKGGGDGFYMRPDRPCNATGIVVDGGKTYKIDIAMGENWRGSEDYPSLPQGFDAFEQWKHDSDNKTLKWYTPVWHWAKLTLGAPMRRVVEAKWLQVLVEVRDVTDAHSRVQIECIALQARPAGVFTGTFKATQDGSMYIFANDAVLPWLPSDGLYRGNKGEAYVRISELKASQAAKAEASERTKSCSAASTSNTR